MARLPGSGVCVAGAGLLPVLLPAPALAHAAPQGFVLLLPTGYWLAGGAAAVALSFAALAAAPDRALRQAFAARLSLRLPRVGVVERAAGWLAFAAFVGLVALGLGGPRDPLANLLPLTLWTALWVGLTALTALFGNLWAVLNPWSAPFRALRRAGLARRGPLPGWAARLGHWPAVAGMAAFGWFELVHPAPEDPGLLARVALAYWAVTLMLMLLAGEEWLRRDEALSVFYGYVARLAPLRVRGGKLVLGLPGWRLLESGPLPVAAVVFVSAALATVTFDGLARTFFWLGLIGINPLDFPGRSAVLPVNTAGYLATIVALNAAFAGAVLAGRGIARPPVPARVQLGRLALTLLPIALGYHLSHYLTVLLVNGQYLLVALGDPMGAGHGRARVTTSFFYDPASVSLIWTVQALAVIAGHLLAVLLAHLIALDLHGGRRAAAVRGQLPLAGLMVLYTLLGLWLLAAPRGA